MSFATSAALYQVALQKAEEAVKETAEFAKALQYDLEKSSSEDSQDIKDYLDYARKMNAEGKTIRSLAATAVKNIAEAKNQAINWVTNVAMETVYNLSSLASDNHWAFQTMPKIEKLRHQVIQAWTNALNEIENANRELSYSKQMADCTHCGRGYSIKVLHPNSLAVAQLAAQRVHEAKAKLLEASEMFPSLSQELILPYTGATNTM